MNTDISFRSLDKAKRNPGARSDNTYFTTEAQSAQRKETFFIRSNLY